MTSPSDILLEAARILMRDGWKQWDMGTDDGPKCTYGAIKAACGVPVNKTSREARSIADLFDQWLRANEDVSPYYGCIIGPWNDRPERTVEDCILALKRAAHEVEP